MGRTATVTVETTRVLLAFAMRTRLGTSAALAPRMAKDMVMGGGGAVKVDARSVRRGSCEDLSVEGPARSEHRRARNLQIITGHGFWRSDSDAVPDATCNCARLATDGSRPASPAFEEGLSQRAGALPGGGMRDLPGFYWDEERQRYFALAQENVARDLSRCDPRRVSAHDEPAHIRADAFVFLSDANNRMASTCPRRDRTHLGANAPENRRRSGKGASSSRVRDPPGDGSRRKKKRGGERARERGADASSRRDPFSSSRRGVAAPSERKPKDVQKQPGPSREKNSASPFDALRARALGMALGGKNLRGRRVASPSDIVAAARRAHVRGLTLAGEIGADAFGHGFELAVDPLRVGHALEHARANATDSIVTPDRILLAGAPHARHESSGNAHSYVKRLRSVDHTGKGWGVAETAVCERRERACVDDAFANRALASSFMARETQRMRAVEWAAARNAGLTGVMGFDDAAGTPDGAPGSDDDSEEDADFATQHGATSHACLSTSLMGDGANRDPARPPGGVAAISLPPLARGGRAGLAPAYRGDGAAHFFAAGDAPGRFREFKNTHPGFFDAAVSPCTGAVACVAESLSLIHI